jgi:hypothetical protein
VGNRHLSILFAALAAVCATARIAAADVPIIRMLPLEKECKAGDPACEKKSDASTKVDTSVHPSGSIHLDAPLPAGSEFKIELRLADLPPPLNADARAVLRIWPLAEQARLDEGSHKECNSRPPDGARQSYQLGMTVSGEGAKQALTATVPALQVGQTFCLDVEIRARMAKTTFETIAKNTAPKLATDLTTKSPAAAASEKLVCNRTDLGGLFTTRLREAIAGPYGDVDLKQAVQAAVPRFQAEIDKCDAVLLLDERIEALQGRITKADAAHEAKLREIKALPALPWNKPPLFWVGDRAEPLDATLERRAKAAELKKAVDQLSRSTAQEAAYAAGDLQIVKKWKDRLAKLVRETENETDAAKTEKAYKAAIADSKSWKIKTAEIWREPPSATGAAKSNGAFVPDTQWAQDPEATSLDAAQAQLGALPDKTEGPGVRDAYRKWTDTVRDLREASAERRAASDAEKAKQEERKKAKEALTASLVTVLGADEVREALSFSVGLAHVQDKAGKGKTAQAASFASADVGVLLAFPSGGTSQEPWVLPYVGLNLYATPVDRTIDFDELTGDGLERLLQRVSLTAGVTLANPGIPGRVVKPIFLDLHPTLALGFRMTQFTRLTGGAVFYGLADKNPVSAAVSVEAAPYLGVSLDADIYYLVNDLYKKVK